MEDLTRPIHRPVSARPALWPLSAGCLALSLLAQGHAAAAVVVDLSVRTVPTLLGAHAEEQFGYASAAGDLDGDGVPELVVGAPGHLGTAGFHSGAVYIFEAASLPDAGSPVRGADAAASIVMGASELGRFGTALATGDLSGDGIADLAVGAPSEGDGSSIGRGRVHVFVSRAGGAPAGDRGADIVIVGEGAGDALGSSLLVSDVDGDGARDLVVCAPGFGAPSRPGAGAVYVVDGAALRGASGEQAIYDIARVRITGEEAGGTLGGLAVADTDGDGGIEILIGAYQSDGPGTDRPDAGRVFVVPVPRIPSGRSVAAGEAATTVIVGAGERGFFGRFIAAGDLDGDGLSDLFVSAYAAGGTTKEESVTGEAFLVFGRRGGLAPALDLRATDALRFRGASRWDLFGFPVLAADLNGDGVADMAAAAQFADAPGDARARCGEVYVLWGGLRSVLRAKSGPVDLADACIIGGEEGDALAGSLLAARFTGAKGPDLVLGAPDSRAAPGCGERCGKLLVVPGAMLVR